MNKITHHIESRLGEFRQHRLFVATSGGIDSMCLLSSLHQLGFDVCALHMNYHLRGEESNLDEEFVKDFCSNHDIKCLVKNVKLKEILEEGGNLQELARDHRYNWFNEILKTYPESFVCLAHHADDQVETFLLNLGRNAGVMGLAAMPFKRGKYLRPFLSLSRREILEYAEANNIQWREDSSNSSNKYKRNLLRNEIIPFLEEEISGIKGSILTMIDQYQSKQKELEERVKPLVELIDKNKSLALHQYEKLDEYERIELLRQLHIPVAMSSEIDKLIDSQKGKKVIIPINETALFLAIIRESNAFSFLPNIQDNEIAKLHVKRVNSLPEVFTKQKIYLDADKIVGDIKLRKWKNGDYIKPIGVNGKKLISDVISDAKIKSIDKSKVLVLTDDATIHWCVGLSIGRESIANERSNTILECFVTFEAIQE